MEPEQMLETSIYEAAENHVRRDVHFFSEFEWTNDATGQPMQTWSTPGYKKQLEADQSVTQRAMAAVSQDICGCV